MNMIIFFVLMVVSALPQVALASQECGELYQKRQENLETAIAALDCYSELPHTPESYYGLMLSSLWLSKAKVSSEKKLKIYKEAIARSEIEISANNSTGKFWRAVFTTFQCNELDGKALIPKHILAKLPEIKQDLRDSISKNPEILHQGPRRISAIMYSSMPGIVGGSDSTALELLTEAHKKSPLFSQNLIWLAKVLIKLKRTSEAKVHLNTLINLNSSEIPSDWIPETEMDQQDAKKLLERI
jgi:hypothetical protein